MESPFLELKELNKSQTFERNNFAENISDSIFEVDNFEENYYESEEGYIDEVELYSSEQNGNYNFEELYQDEEDRFDIDFNNEVGNIYPSRPGISPYAVQALKQWKRSNDDFRPIGWRGKVYGLVVHTTGGSLPGKAINANKYPTIAAIDNYFNTYGCHYINGWQGIQNGDLVQIANEDKEAYGVGMSTQLNSNFEKTTPENVKKLWKQKWGSSKSPKDLLPGTKTANSCYIHVECIPVVYYLNGKTVIDANNKPMRPGLRFTKEQHDSVAILAYDIAIRNNWPLDQLWWKSPRLLGHEDLTPINRITCSLADGNKHCSKLSQSELNKHTCWDPGGLRDYPYFDWEYVYNQIKKIHDNGIDSVLTTPISLVPQLKNHVIPNSLMNEDNLIKQIIQNPQTNSIKSSNTIDISKAIRLNNFYKSNLGWEQYQYQINDFLLPYSGQSNVSLDETSMAYAIAEWQKSIGLTGKNVDGVLGPNSWVKLSSVGNIIPQSSTPSTALNVIGTLGSLIVDTSHSITKNCVPSYQFTHEDALWLARFVEGEAGGRDDADNHAIVWAMYNRFGLKRHLVSSWTSFSKFIRLYSTTLQPFLKSVGAAKRVWHNHNSNPIKYPIVIGPNYYEGTTIKEVQYKKNIDLQNKKWESFSEITRSLVLNILNGKIPNPGIGNASDFANTEVYLMTYRRENGINGTPTYNEWLDFTNKNALSKNRKWIGEKSNLNQRYKNAFFIENQYLSIYSNLVSVLGSPSIHPESLLSESFGMYENYMESQNNEYSVSNFEENYYESNDQYENYEQVLEDNETNQNSILNWLKQSLNKLFSTQLILNNKYDADTIKLLNRFQTEKSIPISSKINAKTERALLETLANLNNNNLEIISTANTKIEDWTNRAIVVKSEITSSYRDPSALFSLVLHQMAFTRSKNGVPSDPNKFLKIGAHFCILRDGRIIQLHPISRMIWHAQCLSHKSVGVEFEGNFPNINGKWWKDKDSKYIQKDIPSQAQYDSGMFLAKYLKVILSITNINAHRQSSENRTNDPGPHIWKNVGEWAISNLGLTDGGNAGKCGTGSAIDPRWRTFNSNLINKEMENYSLADSFESYENYSVEQFKDEYFQTNNLEYIEENESEHENIYGENFLQNDYESEDYRDFEDSEEYQEYEINNIPIVISENRRYSKALGWDKYVNQINDLLLPSSGQNNVSLGEEAFARALEQWQINQGFGNNADGILGPNTWAKLKVVLGINVSPGQPVSKGPVGKNIFIDNQFYAKGILDTINAGFVKVNNGVSRNPKAQLEAIANGIKVVHLDPRVNTIQILPILYHICQQAMKNNYRDIVIGSFIRDTGGHAQGRCIDINFTGNSFTSSGALNMVNTILNYMHNIPSYYKKNFGFGIPFQGNFMKNVGQEKFKSTSVNNVIDNQLRTHISKLGIVFPDNDNHLHIQVRWI